MMKKGGVRTYTNEFVDTTNDAQYCVLTVGEQVPRLAPSNHLNPRDN